MDCNDFSSFRSVTPVCSDCVAACKAPLKQSPCLTDDATESNSIEVWQAPPGFKRSSDLFAQKASVRAYRSSPLWLLFRLTFQSRWCTLSSPCLGSYGFHNFSWHRHRSYYAGEHVGRLAERGKSSSSRARRFREQSSNNIGYGSMSLTFNASFDSTAYVVCSQGHRTKRRAPPRRL